MHRVMQHTGQKLRKTTLSDNVVNEVKEAKYFSILADEGYDVSVKEQLSLVIRFVDSESTIRE